MKIVLHRRESTDAHFTSRAELSALAEVMSRLGLSRRCDSIFLARSYHASEYLNTFVMLLNEGGVWRMSVIFIRSGRCCRCWGWHGFRVPMRWATGFAGLDEGVADASCWSV